jgi:glycosyltransferase involved in cell wall biosynthesis
MTPLVSVVIPSFNHAAFVTQAIDSVLDQTITSVELIVVDDGSTDGSPDIIRAHLEARDGPIPVRFEARENRGIIRILNEALAGVNGKYFAVLGSDDLWAPSKLERQVQAMESAGDHVAAGFSDCWVIDGQGRRRGRMGLQFPFRGGDIYRDLVLLRFFPPAPTSVFLRQAIVDVGGYNERATVTEDVDLWYRVARSYEVAYVDEPLASYRVHLDNVSVRDPVALYRDKMVILEELILRDMDLQPVASRLRARVQANHAGHLYTLLRLPDARRAALSSLRTSPRERLAWRVLIRSLLGTRMVRWLRGKRDVRRRRVVEAEDR